MRWYTFLLISILTTRSISAEIYPKFPKDFIFGVSTSAYQIEGAWNVSGKSENIWDHVTHNYPSVIEDRSNADVACDAYHNIDNDVRLIRELGVDSYRFSISWSRILPDGFSNNLNPDGVRYYNELIDKLLANNIQPFITLFHGDLPNCLQLLGGFTNIKVADYFVSYARLMFDTFGDRVKYWTTFNEPKNFCARAVWGNSEQLTVAENISPYLCVYTVLIAHAKAYEVYKNEFAHQNGKLGIVLDLLWAEPKTNSTKDIEAANRIIEFEFGIYANPIFSKEGDFPTIVKDRVANMSKAQGFEESRLPALTKDEINLIRSSADFLAINHYSTRLISDDSDNINISISSQANDVAVISSVDPSWPTSEMEWLFYVPWGFHKNLMYIKNKYDNPSVYITENGFCEKASNDQGRIKYLQGYLQVLSDAISEGCNILGYFQWSLMDNFEWFAGYTKKFGLYEVNFTDPKRPRKPRASVKWYKDFLLNAKSNV
ncbi:myrosinase 1-like isoform X2 [Chrysoperla carnea]|nr:myrosinase 1-like isoform X2 [Chrysoperla carnea]